MPLGPFAVAVFGTAPPADTRFFAAQPTWPMEEDARTARVTGPGIRHHPSGEG
jgi:hypothetical protein